MHVKLTSRKNQMVAHAFTRSFGQVLGIAIGGGILTSGLSKRLPTDFVGGNGNVAFSAIPAIKSLSVPRIIVLTRR